MTESIAQELQKVAAPQDGVSRRPRRGWTRRARRLPADDHQCGWIETLPPLPAARRLDRDLAVDCAVIGAGFTGMAAARRLAQCRPDWRIALLDAQRAGFGASGRCSGFLVDLVDFTSKMQPADRAGYVAAARRGIDSLRQLTQQHGFDAEWDETGWLRGAVGEAGLRFLQAWPGWLDEAGIAYQWLDRQAMAAVTGSRLYQAGIRLPGYPLIHAGKLVRGLCASLPAAVELFEHSPVRAVHRVPGGGFRLDVGGRAPDGAGTQPAQVVGTAPLCHLSAPRLLLATNGYLPSQRFFAQRVFPCFTFGSMTRELTADEQAALGGEREWGLLAMDPMGTTLRRLRGQRLLIRNTAHYSRSLALGADLRQRMRAFHRQALRARYPQLADIELEYTWGGLMGTSHNSQILFGESEPGLFSAAAFNAAGIAMGTAAGELLAEMAAGQDSELLRAVRALPPPTWMPPEPFRSWGGRFLVARKNALAADYI